MTTNRKLRLAALIGFALHLAVMFYMSPPSVILGPQPLLTLDWSTHYEQCKRAVEAFEHHGRLWNWDPHLLAGQISGAIFDADNKLFELWCVLLVRLGVPFDRAYNLFAWVGSALVYPVVYAASRLFGATLRGAFFGAMLASLVWWFDGFAHWMWFVGMICWAMAGYLYLLPLALLVAYARERRAWMLVALAPTLALVHTLHPYSFLVLVTPMLIVYVRARRALSAKEHAAIVGVAAFTVLANLWWLRVAIRFWHYILDSGYYLDATPDFILWDWLAVVKEPWTSGVIANRSGFRFLAIALGALALLGLRKRKDDRFAWAWPTLAVAFFIAYFGGVTPLLRQVQPYRFLLPGVMLFTVLGGAALDELVAPIAAFVRDRGQRPVAAAGFVLLLVGAPRLLRDVMYFVPDLVPRLQKTLTLPPPDVNGPLEFGSLRWPEPFSFRHGPDPTELAISSYVRQLDDGTGRFLVEWAMTGEQLAGRTDAQILGGFREINLAHSDANFFRVHEERKPIDPKVFGEYLERFNVRWIALVNRYPQIESRRDLLEPIVSVAGGRWYRTKVKEGWLVGGGPAVVRAQSDKLEVRGTLGGSLVLKYHWLETLQCKPGCTIRRVAVEGDRVGFIGVDGAPPDFDVVNAP
jgi:hypothetical protein